MNGPYSKGNDVFKMTKLNLKIGTHFCRPSSKNVFYFDSLNWNHTIPMKDKHLQN